MKMLLTVEFPLAPFNALVRSGKVGETIGRVLETILLNFQASCKFRILMSPDDLQKAGLEALGKTWG